MRNSASENEKKNSSRISTARDALLRWYDEVRRDLPWRKSRDPYLVLLSEIMLQQTRVEVVVTRYESFVARFPSLECLATASEEEVLAAWSGLGYYRRACNLLLTAREIDRRGEWPRSAKELARLPGLGPYTSAAVASIAFGEVVAVVDGNVERVTARLLALEHDPRRKCGRDEIRALAERLLDEQRPGDSNQALMELGATVCRPRAPRCEPCPLTFLCAGRASGDPTAYPRRRATPARRRERHLVVVVEANDEDGQDERVLLVRRSASEEQMAGFWELPWVEAEGDPGTGLRRRYGGRWRVEPPCARVRHAITVRDLELLVCRGRLSTEGSLAEVAEGQEAGFFDAAARAALPTSSVVEKVLAALRRCARPARAR